MSITKLIVVEQTNETRMTCEYEEGEKYSYFVDPETGKFYRPKPTFEVTGENLEEQFEEIIGFSEEVE